MKRRRDWGLNTRVGASFSVLVALMLALVPCAVFAAEVAAEAMIESAIKPKPVDTKPPVLDKPYVKPKPVDTKPDTKPLPPTKPPVHIKPMPVDYAIEPVDRPDPRPMLPVGVAIEPAIYPTIEPMPVDTVALPPIRPPLPVMDTLHTGVLDVLDAQSGGLLDLVSTGAVEPGEASALLGSIMEAYPVENLGAAEVDTAALLESVSTLPVFEDVPVADILVAVQGGNIEALGEVLTGMPGVDAAVVQGIIDVAANGEATPGAVLEVVFNSMDLPETMPLGAIMAAANDGDLETLGASLAELPGFNEMPIQNVLGIVSTGANDIDPGDLVTVILENADISELQGVPVGDLIDAIQNADVEAIGSILAQSPALEGVPVEEVIAAALSDNANPVDVLQAVLTNADINELGDVALGEIIDAAQAGDLDTLGDLLGDTPIFDNIPVNEILDIVGSGAVDAGDLLGLVLDNVEIPGLEDVPVGDILDAIDSGDMAQLGDVLGNIEGLGDLPIQDILDIVSCGDVDAGEIMDVILSEIDVPGLEDISIGDLLDIVENPSDLGQIGDLVDALVDLPEDFPIDQILDVAINQNINAETLGQIVDGLADLPEGFPTDALLQNIFDGTLAPETVAGLVDSLADLPEGFPTDALLDIAMNGDFDADNLASLIDGLANLPEGFPTDVLADVILNDGCFTADDIMAMVDSFGVLPEGFPTENILDAIMNGNFDPSNLAGIVDGLVDLPEGFPTEGLIDGILSGDIDLGTLETLVDMANLPAPFGDILTDVMDGNLDPATLADALAGALGLPEDFPLGDLIDGMMNGDLSLGDLGNVINSLCDLPSPMGDLLGAVLNGDLTAGDLTSILGDFLGLPEDFPLSDIMDGLLNGQIDLGTLMDGLLSMVDLPQPFDQLAADLLAGNLDMDALMDLLGGCIPCLEDLPCIPTCWGDLVDMVLAQICPICPWAIPIDVSALAKIVIQKLDIKKIQMAIAMVKMATDQKPSQIMGVLPQLMKFLELPLPELPVLEAGLESMIDPAVINKTIRNARAYVIKAPGAGGSGGGGGLSLQSVLNKAGNMLGGGGFDGGSISAAMNEVNEIWEEDEIFDTDPLEDLLGSYFDDVNVDTPPPPPEGEGEGEGE